MWEEEEKHTDRRAHPHPSELDVGFMEDMILRNEKVRMRDFKKIRKTEGKLDGMSERKSIEMKNFLIQSY